MEVVEGCLDTPERGSQGGHGGEVDAPALDVEGLRIDVPKGFGNDGRSAGAGGAQVDGGVVVLGHDRDESGAAGPWRRELGVGLLEGGGSLIELDGRSVVVAVLQRGDRLLGVSDAVSEGLAGTKGAEPERHGRRHGDDNGRRDRDVHGQPHNARVSTNPGEEDQRAGDDRDERRQPEGDVVLGPGQGVDGEPGGDGTERGCSRRDPRRADGETRWRARSRGPRRRLPPRCRRCRSPRRRPGPRSTSAPRAPPW